MGGGVEVNYGKTGVEDVAMFARLASQVNKKLKQKLIFLKNINASKGQNHENSVKRRLIRDFNGGSARVCGFFCSLVSTMHAAAS